MRKQIAWWIAGTLVLCLGPVLVSLYAVPSHVSFVLGFMLCAFFSERIQQEIDERRREQDARFHEWLQGWYKKKHGTDASGALGYAQPVKNVLTYGDQ